ncbi:DUF2750 domain-containing protein [Hahella sp. SMD15-11]|uniref:DUF2750 domain-containing protein n=1 Tax=Thermohahella caldifontis TaxID=3142973 RepID=A0AB39UXX5_9GAMM
MSHQENSETNSPDCETRYEAFLDAVIETREIWILVNSRNEFLKIFAEDEGFEYVPLWPDADSAARYAAGDEDLTPHALTLPEFLKKWVAGLTGDQLEVGVWPAGDGTVWVLSAEELKAELNELLSGF